jgi:uncharacterized protein
VIETHRSLVFLAETRTRLGAPVLAESVLLAYRQASGDRPPARLLDFYFSHHAMIRAIVALWHLDDPAVTEHSRWVRRAREYVRLARRIAE